MWVYIFEDCDICGGKGKAPGMIDDVMVSDAPCDLCDGQGRRRTNMCFKLPARLMNPTSVDAALEEMMDKDFYP